MDPLPSAPTSARLSGVGCLGSDMVPYLWIRDTVTSRERRHSGPGLWAKGPPRPRGLREPGDQDGDPAAPKDTDQAQAGRAALAARAGQRVPGCGTTRVNGRSVVCGSGRKAPPLWMCRHGCQPRRTRRRNSQGAYRPRSAHPITVHSREMAGRSWRSLRRQGRRHAWGT